MEHRLHRTLIALCLAAVLLAGCSPAAAELAPALPSLPAPTIPPLPSHPAGPLSTPALGPLVNPLLNQLYTATATSTATITLTPTVTSTHTALPTFTSTFTQTPTASNTPRPSITSTPSETPAPSRPAVLFPFKDLDGNTVDWSYTRVTNVLWDQKGVPVTLSAFVSFQLLDRGIHRETIQVLGRDLTVYYLNAQHEFFGQIYPFHITVSGQWGKDVPLANLSAGANYFVQAQALKAGEPFDPANIHGQSVKNYTDKLAPYQGGMQIVDFQRLLATLPDKVILLVDSPVRIPASSFPDVDYYFQKTPNLAADFWPMVKLDPLNKVSAPSDYAWALTDTLFHNKPLPETGLPDPLTDPGINIVFVPGGP